MNPAGLLPRITPFVSVEVTPKFCEVVSALEKGPGKLEVRDRRRRSLVVQGYSRRSPGSPGNQLLGMERGVSRFSSAFVSPDAALRCSQCSTNPKRRRCVTQSPLSSCIYDVVRDNDWCLSWRADVSNNLLWEWHPFSLSSCESGFDIRVKLTPIFFISRVFPGS